MTMIRLQRILCATDFSDDATEALEAAIELARSFDATLQVVHVLEPPVLFGSELTTSALITEVVKQQQERADAGLARALERCRTAGVSACSQLEIGSPGLRLAELSKQADLMVVGTRGRTGIDHLLLGSVAERVVRLSHCPVLVFRKKAERATGPT
jgi:nucleotide-binding universal stress UspA family protein